MEPPEDVPAHHKGNAAEPRSPSDLEDGASQPPTPLSDRSPSPSPSRSPMASPSPSLHTTPTPKPRTRTRLRPKPPVPQSANNIPSDIIECLWSAGHSIAGHPHPSGIERFPAAASAPKPNKVERALRYRRKGQFSRVPKLTKEEQDEVEVIERKLQKAEEKQRQENLESERLKRQRENNEEKERREKEELERADRLREEGQRSVRRQAELAARLIEEEKRLEREEAEMSGSNDNSPLDTSAPPTFDGQDLVFPPPNMSTDEMERRAVQLLADRAGMSVDQWMFWNTVSEEEKRREDEEVAKLREMHRPQHFKRRSGHLPHRLPASPVAKPGNCGNCGRDPGFSTIGSFCAHCGQEIDPVSKMPTGVPNIGGDEGSSRSSYGGLSSASAANTAASDNRRGRPRRRNANADPSPRNSSGSSSRSRRGPFRRSFAFSESSRSVEMTPTEQGLAMQNLGKTVGAVPPMPPGKPVKGPAGGFGQYVSKQTAATLGNMNLLLQVAKHTGKTPAQVVGQKREEPYPYMLEQ